MTERGKEKKQEGRKEGKKRAEVQRGGEMTHRDGDAELAGVWASCDFITPISSKISPHTVTSLMLRYIPINEEILGKTFEVCLSFKCLEIDGTCSGCHLLSSASVCLLDVCIFDVGMGGGKEAGAMLLVCLGK